MSTSNLRPRKFSPRRIIAVAVISLIIGSLVPIPVSATVLRSTDEIVRTVGNKTWILLISALGALGFEVGKQGQ